MNVKSLAKDTALYGLSSIAGKFLNYLLVPLYTYKIAAESGGYGVVTNLYAYSALLLVLLTFGMETTFFRFSGKEGADEKMVYGTSLRLVGGVAIVFLAAVLAFLGPISGAMGYASHPWYVGCFALIVAQDAFQSIMFARLRQQHRPLRFVALKLSFIVLNVALNLFIFLALPSITGRPSEVGMIFLANLLCTTLITFTFIPEMKGLLYGFDRGLALKMLSYAWPILLLGLIGILNQVADKILFPWLVPGSEGQVQLGIYGACAKVAMIMAMLTQAFRYAYEPIVFGGGKDRNDPTVLSDGMKYFVVFALLGWLCVMAYLPLLKYLVHPSYWDGLKVVPIVMMAEIFMGVYFNLSFWYKLTDKTWWGAILSACGAAVMIGVNVAFVPKFGYVACAWGGFAGYFVAMVLSWIAGRGKMDVKYDTGRIAFFSLAFLVLAAGVLALQRIESVPVQLCLGTVLVGIYALAVWKKVR